MKEIIVNKNDAGQRLDKFIIKFMPKLPKSMLYKGLRKNFVRINGKHAKDGSVFLNEGDVLNLYWNDDFFEKAKTFIPIKAKPDIIYEDNNIMLINKKIGTVVHTDDRGTEGTLIEQIQSYLFEKGEYNPDSEHSFAPSLCNRLDRNTSGLIIAAKNAAALRIINEKIRQREIHKIYMCIVEGHPKESDTLSAYLTKLEKKVDVSDLQKENSKKSELKYATVASNKTHSLLEVELLTGRTHQIRAMLAHIGHPIAGDTKYGGKQSDNYQELVSHRIIFDFKSDAGILEYLNGQSFSISVHFEKYFLR